MAVPVDPAHGTDALLLGVYGLWRWRHRATDPLPARQIVHIVSLGALAVAVGFSWQVIAGIATDDPSAYLHTELSWRRGWTGDDGGFVPFEGFVQASVICVRFNVHCGSSCHCLRAGESGQRLESVQYMAPIAPQICYSGGAA